MDKMTKEEILRRSREEKKDEGIEFVRNKAAHWGIVGILLVFCVLVIFNLFTGQDSASIQAMFWSYLGMQNLGWYYHDRTKSNLIIAILGIICGVLNLINYIFYVLG